MFRGKYGKVHFIGIGGSGMSGIAEVLANLGYSVSGSDLAESATTRRLQKVGIRVDIGHAAGNAAGADALVVSTAVKEDNPELVAARASRTPIVPRALMLAELMRLKQGIAIAGTHGKTTTTAMLSWVLAHAGLTPGFLIGGVPLNFGVSARLGALTQGQSRPLFVIEADEYDTAFFDKRSKFVHYRPRTAVLNNLEFDHADIFPDLAAIERQFHHLVRTVPASGRLVVNAEQDSLQQVLTMGHWSEVALFGASPNAAWQLHGEPSDFEVLHQGAVKGRVQWALGGVHNQMNALAAVIAADHIGVAVEHACQALSSFENVRRRMEVRGTVGTGTQAITVYDDFAHHPTAIRTTLDGLRRQVGTARILAVFEPRSNTMKLGQMKSQLPWSLEQANLTFCHTAGLDWDAAQALAAMGNRAHTAGDIDSLVALVKAAARPGDHVLFMSNGGFGGVHDKLLQALKN